MPDEGYRHIGRCPRLETLWLSRDSTDAAVAHVQGLSTLKRIDLPGIHFTDRSLEILATMPSLETIELRECRGVSNAGVALLASLPRLQELRLSSLPKVTREALAGFPARVKVRYSPT